MPSLIDHISAVLPQTQCRQCGYDGCTPYAIALSRGEAALNLCTPGGNSVIQDLAGLLNLPALPPADSIKSAIPKAIAVIDEQECIGCTACIKACPVDAIIGSTKKMHTILTAECTGCELCLPPCPVDCIHMQPVEDQWLPRARTLDHAQTNSRSGAATQARIRHQHRTERLERLRASRHTATSLKPAINTAAPFTTGTGDVKPKLNPADLIAQAMARAHSQQNQRQKVSNQTEFQQQQIRQAQQRATYRRAERDLQYGTAEQKNAALVWLREYKAQQQKEQD